MSSNAILVCWDHLNLLGDELDGELGDELGIEFGNELGANDI